MFNKKMCGGGGTKVPLYYKILTKGGYRCSFPDEGWCQSLDCRRGWLC